MAAMRINKKNPITLKNRNEGTENPYPDYYYRVDENAKPVEGEIKLAKND